MKGEKVSKHQTLFVVPSFQNRTLTYFIILNSVTRMGYYFKSLLDQKDLQKWPKCMLTFWAI